MTWRERAVAVLREPLVHFLFAGALVFALLSGRAPNPGERRIVVNEAIVSGLVSRWSESFHRAPTQAEIDGLIRDYVRDQVYYREALRLGLDKDDEVVMRRMRNKMIALATNEAEAAEPSDAQLRALLDKDPARYAPEPLISFTQLYFGADEPASRAAAAAALAGLKGGAAPGKFGEPLPIPAQFTQAPASEIAESFGGDFTAALRKLPVGVWTGPQLSGLGIHLVRVEARSVPPPPAFADVRPQLENDWRAEQRRKAEDDGYRRLLEGYDVVIERPK